MQPYHSQAVQSNTDKITHYDVCDIYNRKDQYGKRETIARNHDFGRVSSRAFNNEEKAL